MLKLTKVITATALGLVIGLSSFAPGAFAQSVNQSPANHTIVVQGVHQTGPAWKVNNTYDNNRWNNKGNYNKSHARHVRCVRVFKWIKSRHGKQRVSYQVCHRY